MHRRFIFILITFLLIVFLTLAACLRQPNSNTIAIKIADVEPTFVSLTRTANAIATITSIPTITPTATVEPTAILTPPRNWMPMLELTKVPGLLQSNLSVEKVDSFSGHDLQKITGWEYGFDYFQWMGESHLLVSAIFGPRSAEGSSLQPSYPAVINLDKKVVWTPKLTEDAVWDRVRALHQYLPSWSSKLGALITSETTPAGDAVRLYSADGDLVAEYPGQLLGISPSGTKMLFQDGTWLDLISGKTVHFTWNQGYIDEYYHNPVWSDSENRVYVNRFLFGDAKTGDSYAAQDDNREVKGMAGAYDLANGIWVLNDKYLMRGCCENWFFGGPPTFFDFSTKTFHYLSELVNIPMDSFDHEDENQCNYWFISPNRKNVWLACSKNEYLVDLATRKFNQYSPYMISDIQWSADGNFALISGTNLDNRPFVRILSVDTKELKFLPDNHYCSWWHPTDNILACESKDARTMSLLNAQTISDQKVLTLPFEIQKIIFSPDGKRIALLGRDSSLWQVDYPTFENLEQLTPAMPELTHLAYGTNINESLIKNVTWSPDGNFLSFIGGADIYIVDTRK
jgi:WD40 repeat protein